jgi:hypothetical protein
MIYRNWSLLSSTVVIWGGVATAGLAGIFVFGGKVLPLIPFNSYVIQPKSSVRVHIGPFPSPYLRQMSMIF